MAKSEPQHLGRKTEERLTGAVLAQGADSVLIRTEQGDIVVTDKNGVRRT